MVNNDNDFAWRPEVCDYCKVAITGDDWMEADAWHICGDCHRALMDGTAEEFNARRDLHAKEPTNAGK